MCNKRDFHCARQHIVVLKLHWRSTDDRHRCSKNYSLIWNKIRAQLHDSAHQTHSVTLMGGGERENQPVRSQSARPKNRRGTKTWNAKPKCYWALPPRRPPSFSTRATIPPQGQDSLLPPRALPPQHPPHEPLQRSKAPKTNQ